MSRGRARVLIVIGGAMTLAVWLGWWMLMNYGCGFGSTSREACDWIAVRQVFGPDGPYLLLFLLPGLGLMLWGWRSLR